MFRVSLVLITLLFSSTAHAAITVDATSEESGSAKTATVDHTVGSGDDKLIVTGGGWERSGNSDLESVNWNGSETYTVEEIIGDFSSPAVWIAQLINPTSATDTVTVVHGEFGTIYGIGSVSFFGAKQSGQPDNSTSTSHTSDSTPQISITPVVDDTALVDCIEVANSGVTISGADGGQTIFVDVTPTGHNVACSYKILSGGGGVSQTMGWTLSASTNSIHVVMSIAPVADERIKSIIMVD